MIINGSRLLDAAPIKDMISAKRTVNGVSHGLTECGYDIRIAEDVIITPGLNSWHITASDGGMKSGIGRMVLASSMEEFDMPTHLMGRVLNKSTWARKGLDASMTTNIEPGWKGFLTLELIYHGTQEIEIPAGTGIAQVIFETIAEAAVYRGKYQNQEAGPQEARFGWDQPVQAHEDLLPPQAMSDNTKAMLDFMYLPPDHQYAFMRTMWNSFDKAQQRKLLQDAKAQGHTELPAWMKPEEGPVCIVDAKGVHPEALDNAVHAQSMYGRGVSDEDLKKSPQFHPGDIA